MALTTAITTNGIAQEDKKVQTFKVSKVLPFSAKEVWKVVGEDYGAIAHSHPKIIQSDYIHGSLQAGEGAERVCYFNDKQTRFLEEKMIDYSPETMTFTNKVTHAGKFPMDPDYTQAVYSVKEVDENSALLSFNMQYRTKPAIMGAIAKGKFKKLINDYFIAIEHHLRTGESVTKENFKKAKKDVKAYYKAQSLN